MLRRGCAGSQRRDGAFRLSVNKATRASSRCWTRASSQRLQTANRSTLAFRLPTWLAVSSAPATAFATTMVSTTVVVQLAVIALGFYFSARLGYKGAQEHELMMQNRRPGAPGSSRYYPFGQYSDSTRYTDEGNAHREKGNQLFRWSFAVLLLTGLAVGLIHLLGPQR